MKTICGALAILAVAPAVLGQQRSESIDNAALRAAGKTEAAAREWITYSGN
jgi:hypothetical protein